MNNEHTYLISGTPSGLSPSSNSSSTKPPSGTQSSSSRPSSGAQSNIGSKPAGSGTPSVPSRNECFNLILSNF